MISFGKAIKLFYKNYVNFEGRSSRAEYWWPVLLQLGVYAVLAISFFANYDLGRMESANGADTGALIIMMISGLFYLVNFLPGLSLKVRRFHDLDQTGWLVLVFWAVNIFVPVVEFARMIWFAVPGTEGSNQYGPDPYGYDGEIFG